MLTQHSAQHRLQSDASPAAGRPVSQAVGRLLVDQEKQRKGKMDTLTHAEKESIEEEIKKAIGDLIQGCETLDMDMAFGMFSNSPDFLMIGTDGTYCDYNTYLGNNIDYLKTCSNFKLTTHGKKIRILDRNTAIYSWSYGAEATLKTGERDIIEKAGASFVFRRMGDEWKVVYYHEASVPPTRLS
ncbi:MAG: hypothetical protein ABIF04_04555 [Chloroflexota bacterium]